VPQPLGGDDMGLVVRLQHHDVACTGLGVTTDDGEEFVFQQAAFLLEASQSQHHGAAEIECGERFSRL